ncbi:MAG: YeeE/YedE family protein [Actinomycetota bacterium]|nr:YeeE/YedE family protein [Actinomycetota bacterium]
MSSRLAGLCVGVVFGVTLSWSGMTSPVVIRQALLFERSYLFLFFAGAVAVATVGLMILRRMRIRALLTGQPINWRRERVRREHVIGSLIFGLGWGVSDACPGPIATQVGQGILWGAWTLLGVILGVYLFLRRDQPDTEPAVERTLTAPT